MDAHYISQFITNIQPKFQAGDAGAGEKGIEGACVGIVERSYRAVARGDFEGFKSMLDEDVEFEFAGPSGTPFVARCRGREDVFETVSRNYSIIENQKPEILRIVAQGEDVAVIARESGRLKSTGRDYSVTFLHLFTIRNGKIAKLLGFSDGGMVVAAS